MAPGTPGEVWELSQVIQPLSSILIVETTDGGQAILPLALVLSNESKRNAGTLKELPRTVSWFDEDSKDVESPIRRLPFLLICDGHANRQRKQDAQLIECPFIYAGPDAIDQSRWGSITPRYLTSLQAWTIVNCALDRILQDAPNIIGSSLETPLPLETLGILTVPYEYDENEDFNGSVDEDDDQQDQNALWVALQEEKRETVVRANDLTLT